MSLRTTLQLGCVVVIIICAPSEAAEVFVRGTSGALGHGHLRIANGQCYVVTAKHLVADPGEAKVVLFNGTEATATVADRDSSDVAILKVSKSSICENVGNPSTKGLGRLLQTESSGRLELIEEDGSLARIKVELTHVGNNQIDIESDTLLSKGISGSTLMVRGRPAGMIIHSEGKRAAALPMTFVETVWDRYIGKVPNCDDGCEVALKDLSLIEHKEQDDTSTQGMRRRRVDYVYQFPENWPTPPFFHVIKEVSIITLPDMPPQSDALKVTSFSFSSSATPFAQDFFVSGIAFDISGSAEAPFTKGMQNWWIRIQGTSNLDDITVSIKKPAPLFGQNP